MTKNSPKNIEQTQPSGEGKIRSDRNIIIKFTPVFFILVIAKIWRLSPGLPEAGKWVHLIFNLNEPGIFNPIFK